MALLTVKETSDVLGMPIKFVEDLMDKGKDGTKLKSQACLFISKLSLKKKEISKLLNLLSN